MQFAIYKQLCTGNACVYLVLINCFNILLVYNDYSIKAK